MKIELENKLLSDFSAVLNRHSIENLTNTPDFILAKYLVDCLESFNSVMKTRDAWRSAKPFTQTQQNNQS